VCVLVGVQLLRQAAECCLDLCLAGCAGHIQGPVVCVLVRVAAAVR
jgi:hypothetical protein